jgi:signal transduction histidine kinase/CheY-like chemotaxis protein
MICIDILIPLGSKERWFAGSLAWSTSPTRTLCPTEDVTYIAAFGNSIMAEISRLSALQSAQMKRDFVSSVSHELRSPLHGVLASVEFLQETEMTHAQSDMVDTINSCGKTLLDTINHVLEFSKLDEKSKDRKRSRKSNRRSKSRQSRTTITKDCVTKDDPQDLCMLFEEVIDSVYVGRNMGKERAQVSRSNSSSTTDKQTEGSSLSYPPVVVVVDVCWRDNWDYQINSGAWRRILMNIFSNAMKYTERGFVRAVLQADDPDPSKKRSQPMVTLTIKDSGKGISKDFLQSGLYTAFEQEDTLAVGTGLGLSIVRKLVTDMGGSIHFDSETGFGTEVRVSLPLTASVPRSINHLPYNIQEIRQQTQGLDACLVAFDVFPDLREIPTGILSAYEEAMIHLKSSIVSVMRDWFSMTVSMAPTLHVDSARIHLIVQSGVAGNDNLEQLIRSSSAKSTKPLQQSAVIVLSGIYSQSTNFTTEQGLRVVYLYQPYGPHKLAKTLHQIFCQPIRDLVRPSQLDSAEKPASTHGHASNHQVDSSMHHRHATNTKEGQSPDEHRDIIIPLPRSTSLKGSYEIQNPKLTNLNDKDVSVLLVEDNQVNLKLLVMFMQKLKLHYITATNGLEALEAYQTSRGRFDFIFMDISMPVMDGLEAAREIRDFERKVGSKAATIIALTGAASPSVRQEAFSSGINLFLTKPVPLKRLKAIVEKASNVEEKTG